MEQPIKVIVNESINYELEPANLVNLDLIALTNSKYHVLKNDKSFKVNLIKSNFSKRAYLIEVNSNKYHVKILNSIDETIKKIGLSIGISKKSMTLLLPCLA